MNVWTPLAIDLLAKEMILFRQQQYNFKMSKIRKIYNLRKTANLKTQQPPEQSRISELKQEPQIMKASDVIQKNASGVASINHNKQQLPSKVFQQPLDYLVDGQELSINKLQLHFQVPINDIDKKDVKIKNIGNSAVYVQFNFKNSPKINQNGFKDTQGKFYCHYNTTVIKPGQEVTFIFSFISQFPGSFTEQVEISCQPPLKTPIPNLKLNGNSFINDQWFKNRQNFNCNLDDIVLKNEVREILSDVVNNVRLPPPPLPDVKNPKVAQKEFEQQNAHLNLYYNQYLHGWFNELFNEVCQKAGKAEDDRYWNQSVEYLSNMIENAEYLDQVEKICFKNRIEHYCYLSMNPPANKSQLYQTVYEFVSAAAYNLGGDYVDAVRKELDMWEIPFREPLQTDTEEDLKTRKDEVEKIKAEWLKRAKKKKWGEQQQKQMINQFKKKVQQKTNEDIHNRFDNFEQGAQFIKSKQIIKKSSFQLNQYHRHLETVKTVRQCPLDGKKVLLKWHLKLKDNCEDKLKELEEYLNKKKELEKRLEEQKKQGAKKKKTAKPKKKGQKQQQEQKPLFFDFMSILDEQNWNGFTQTFKVVLEKQPFLVMIGITYGPRSGRHLPEYSVQFLLEHLKTIEPAIDFFPHSELSTLKVRLETQSINQGTILLLQNLNFLPWEVAQQEIVEPAAQEGQQAKISKRKLLQPEIRQFFDNFGQSIDILINEDRYLQGLSGFTAYLNKQVIMGTQWWKYVGLSTRVVDSNIVFGDDFTPSTHLLLARLANVARSIRLTGKSGMKVYMVKNNLEKVGDIALGSAEKEAIKSFLQYIDCNNLSQKVKIPCDFLLKKCTEEQTQTMVFDGSQQDTQGWQVIDIGDKSVQQIKQICQGHLFVLGQTSVAKSNETISASLSLLIRDFFKKQEAKKERHVYQSNSPSGIDYNQDLVIHLVGLNENLIQKVDLKDKKGKTSEEDEEEPAEQQQQSDKKKVELVSDFRLSSLPCLYRLWNGKFDMPLKDVSKYQMIQDA